MLTKMDGADGPIWRWLAGADDLLARAARPRQAGIANATPRHAAGSLLQRSLYASPVRPVPRACQASLSSSVGIKDPGVSVFALMHWTVGSTTMYY
ncbi:hypothetical protein U9M48_021698 [Paspalum notatum var. saurae]|uniref:Uncharacterized protein n=1 Tax=Paspalum notatum var. saurae TaxID=547442 RepID=A0AAQ3TJK3_PASNO